MTVPSQRTAPRLGDITTAARLASVALWLLLLMVGCHQPHPATPSEHGDVIPTKWIDLPDAPFAARLVQSGKNRVVTLVNRTKRSFDFVQTGCVIERDGKAAVVAEYFVTQVHDGTLGPGEMIDNMSLMRDLNEFDRDAEAFRQALRAHTGVDLPLKPCPLDGRFAIVGAGMRDGYRWSAEGTAWPAAR